MTPARLRSALRCAAQLLSVEPTEMAGQASAGSCFGQPTRIACSTTGDSLARDPRALGTAAGRTTAIRREFGEEKF
jgi:hypothetical protein